MGESPLPSWIEVSWAMLLWVSGAATDTRNSGLKCWVQALCMQYPMSNCTHTHKHTYIHAHTHRLDYYMDFVFIPLGIVNGLCQWHLDKGTHASLYPAYKYLFAQNLLCFHFPFYVSSNATNERFNYVDIFLWKAWGVISWFISFITGHFGWIWDSSMKRPWFVLGWDGWSICPYIVGNTVAPWEERGRNSSLISWRLRV